MNKKIQSKSKSTVTYTLFLYQEELRRRNALYLRLSKIQLTDGLISKSVRKIELLNAEELKNLNREILYKRKLKMQLANLKKIKKQRKENVKQQGLVSTLV